MDRFWTDTVDRLTFAFQPIVSCRDGSIIAVEALVRGWREAGFRGISDIFDLASTDGKLVEVENALREKSLRLFSLLPLPEKAKLFSNLDNRVFGQPGWRPGSAEVLLGRLGLDPQCLVLEISERHPFFPEDTGWEGTALALDDFGTGFSGLKSLLTIRPAYVKIDRFFVSGLGSDPLKEAFFEGLVSLARRMGAFIIAEGVETRAELEFCLASGCDALQGFAIARPAFNGEAFSGLASTRQGLLFSSLQA